MISMVKSDGGSVRFDVLYAIICIVFIKLMVFFGAFYVFLSSPSVFLLVLDIYWRTISSVKDAKRKNGSHYRVRVGSETPGVCCIYFRIAI